MMNKLSIIITIVTLTSAVQAQTYEPVDWTEISADNFTGTTSNGTTYTASITRDQPNTFWTTVTNGTANYFSDTDYGTYALPLSDALGTVMEPGNSITFGFSQPTDFRLYVKDLDYFFSSSGQGEIAFSTPFDSVLSSDPNWNIQPGNTGIIGGDSTTANSNESGVITFTGLSSLTVEGLQVVGGVENVAFQVTALVPEPSSTALLGLSALGLLFRRKR